MCKKFVPGLIVGALVGAGIALLVTPKSGKELREDLLDKSEDLKAIALDYMELLTVKGEELLTATKDTTDSLVEKFNDKKDELADTLAEKTDALTEALNDKKEALTAKLSEVTEKVSQ
ncbi:YtxH domain-containing protein [Carnobacteriaceae bacterium zg-ZUI252]|nr:YtxH domain-containing protein [Carnobacteriaceae bacterium zg-ZUI252]MBS4769942.1 YtxH domain-containing protein [Carnobacteriaceae bacterium zg-ZUI240]QTU83349.1 YtxH domain-containing protein [Carnobacteriaceae bacterium zg-C25]